MNDPFTLKLQSAALGMANVTNAKGYWFVNNRLVILPNTQVREILF